MKTERKISRWEYWDYGKAAAYFITIVAKDRNHFFGKIKNEKMQLSNIGVLADVLWYEIKNHAKNVSLDTFIIMPNHIHGILILNKDSHEVQTRHALSHQPQSETDHLSPETDQVRTRHALSHQPQSDTNHISPETDQVRTRHALSQQKQSDTNFISPETDQVRTRHALSHQPQSDTNHISPETDQVRTRHALSQQKQSDTNLISPETDQVRTRHALSQQTSSQQLSPGQKRFQNQGKNTVSSIIGSYKSAVTRHARRLGYEFAWQPRFHDHIIRNEQAYINISNYIINNPIKWQEDKFHHQ